MGIFKLNGIDYMGGGSGGNIQPGLGYKETVLWEDTSGASPSSAITLSSALNNYDAIYIITASNAEPNYRSTQIIPVSAIDTTGTTNFGIFDTGANNYYYVVLNYVDSTHITLSSWGSSYPIKYYKVVGINYGAGGTPIQPIIYSEEEREVGVWTDGKPLYQKTWIYTATSVITSSTVIGNYDANTVEIKAISSQATEGTTDYLLPYVSGGGGYSSITTSNGDILLAVSNASWGNGSIIKVTIQYTKTTDTPGSGTWTPQGIPAVHYDDTEKVVGTWFGETLYEKSYYVQGVKDSTITVDSSITGTTVKLIEVKQTFFTTGGVYANVWGNNSISYSMFLRTLLGNAGLGVNFDGYRTDYYGNDGFDVYLTIRYTKISSS